MSDPLLEARDLAVLRDGRTVVRQVELRVGPGQCVAIVGPNGAGKTTLLLGLLGLLPTTGTVHVQGTPRERLSRRALARRVAFVPQTYDGFGAFSVRAFVQAARFAHLRGGRGTDADLAAVDDALARCSVADLAERALDTLSIGQRQRVLLAGAVAQAAPLLLLDEPTAALDPQHQAEFVALLADLIARRGVGVVWVSHDLNLPGHLDAEVLALRDGQAAFAGPWSAFIAPATLERVYSQAFDVQPRDHGPPLIAWRSAPAVAARAIPG